MSLSSLAIIESLQAKPDAPTLSSPADASTATTLTPTFQFSASDPESNALEYMIQFDTSSTFTSEPLKRTSLYDPGFSSGHPFTSGSSVTFTPTISLYSGTIYWRVAAMDPSGSGAYGAWSSSRSLTIPSNPTMVQYAADHSTTVATGASTTDGVSTNLYLDFTASTNSPTENITPKVEVKSVGTSFSNTATSTGSVFNFSQSVPVFRSYPSVIYDSANSRLIVFGGRERVPSASIDIYKNDVWELKLPSLESEQPTWRLLSPSGTAPSARNAALAVYDSTYQRMIVYCGLNGSTDYNDFYYLTLPSGNDGAWGSFSPSGNTSTTRWGSAGVYDPGRTRLVFYGGNHFSTNTDLSDAWEVSLPSDLSGSNSVARQMSPSGSVTNPTRSEHSAVYDTTNGRMVIFAGWSGASRVNTSFALTLPGSGDGALSNLTSTGAPSARSSHAAIYDSANNRMVTFMGWNGTAATQYSDIYQLDLTSGSEAWSQKSSSTDGVNGSGRYGHAAIYDSVNQRAVMFGGYGPNTNGLNYPFNEPNIISLPSSGTLYYNEYGLNVNLMAGDGSMSTYDSTNSQMVRFGGYGRIYDTAFPEDTGYHINETWTYGVSDNRLSNITPSISPGGREVCSLIYDSLNKRVIMWGGLSYNQNSSYNETWAMSMDSTNSNYKKWVRLSPTGTGPTRRWGAAAIYDSANQRMVLFGGAQDKLGTGATFYNDVFTLSLTSGSEAWSSSGSGLTIVGTPPSGRFQSTPVYDSGNNRMLMLGGQTGVGAYTNTLWELAWTAILPNTMTWTDRTPTYSPTFAARRGHTAVYQGDFSQKRMIVFGGWDGTTHYNQVWNFDITSSTVTATLVLPTTSSPPVRRSHNAIYDAVNQRMLIQGGRGSSTPTNFFSDFWELTLPSSTGSWRWQQLYPDPHLKASVAVTGLSAGSSYHWQAWFTGSTSGDSLKASYGNNAESATDFSIPGSSGVKFWNGTSWGYKPLKVWNGSSWVAKPIKVWNGSQWNIKG